MNRLSLGALALLAVLAVAEIAARAAGLVDVPVYRLEARRGYFPAPNQHGRFLNSHDWVFNDHSMGAMRPYAPSVDGVILVGDSVVSGGGPLGQSERVGPALEALIHRPVWPLAAGGWAFENELKAIEADPVVLQAPIIVFVSNVGDFGAQNFVPDESQMPTHPPRSALLFLARKYVFKPRVSVDSPRSPAAEALWRADLNRFLAAYHGRLIWVLYPDRFEIGATPAFFKPLVDTLHGRAEIIDLSTSPRWTANLYRDAGIHPSARGDKVMAAIIAAQIQRPR